VVGGERGLSDESAMEEGTKEEDWADRDCVGFPRILTWCCLAFAMSGMSTSKTQSHASIAAYRSTLGRRRTSTL
jgi:hypothetical protein